MKSSTKQVLTILLVLAWIIFVGICIEAGGYLTNAVFTLANPSVVGRLWHQADLSDLLRFGTQHYFTMMVILTIVSVLKAVLFYLIIKNLHDKKLSMAQPFNLAAQRLIFQLAYVVLLIGLFSVGGIRYTAWLVKQGVNMPDTQALPLSGADVWLFMCVILYVIGQIFKRGIDIQTENELTV